MRIEEIVSKLLDERREMAQLASENFEKEKGLKAAIENNDEDAAGALDDAIMTNFNKIMGLLNSVSKLTAQIEKALSILNYKTHQLVSQYSRLDKNSDEAIAIKSKIDKNKNIIAYLVMVLQAEYQQPENNSIKTKSEERNEL